MTRVNDYLWQLPHQAEMDDPEDVLLLRDMFNQPITQACEDFFLQGGYKLTSSDIHVPPDKVVTLADMANTYVANVRFVKHGDDNIIYRVHFEHGEWAKRLPTSDTHRYVVNVDRFRVQDRKTMIVEPEWAGRLTTRISNLDDTFEYTGEDGVWTYTTRDDFLYQLERIKQKLQETGFAWVES